MSLGRAYLCCVLMLTGYAERISGECIYADHIDADCHYSECRYAELICAEHHYAYLLY